MKVSTFEFGEDIAQSMARVLQIASGNCGQVTLLNKPGDIHIINVVSFHVKGIHITNVKISKLYLEKAICKENVYDRLYDGFTFSLFSLRRQHKQKEHGIQRQQEGNLLQSIVRN